MVFSIAFLFLLVITGVTGRRSDYVTSISPHANTPWGHWGHAQWCANGQYAYGFQLKVQGELRGRDVDNTAVNGIRLHCRSVWQKHGGDVTSSVQVWGKWGIRQYCSWGSFLRGVSMRSDRWRRSQDDTAVNNFKFHCQRICCTRKTRTLTGHGTHWGSWSSAVYCPKNSYICGIRTKIEGLQWYGDDTALNDAIFYCCRLRKTRICGA